jgi:uncharacterized membrane protein YbhN (UPF0104 family)
MNTVERSDSPGIRQFGVGFLAFLRSAWQLFSRVMSGPYGSVIRFGVAAVLLIVIFSRVDLQQMATVITSLSPSIVGLALLVNLFAWVVNSYKWQLLLTSYGIRHRLDGLLRLNLVANFFSKALPGQVTGEVLKAIRLSGSTKQQQGVFASIFLDRVTGLVAIAILGAAALLISPPPLSGIVGMAPMLGALSVIAIGGALFLGAPTLFGRSNRLKAITQLPHFRYVPAFLSFADSEGRRPGGRQLGIALILALIFQMIIVVFAWLLTVAVGIDASPVVLSWVMAVVAIGYLLPISFAGVGVREGILVGFLSLYGVPANQALTMSLVMFAIEMVVATLGGVINLFGGATSIGS